MSYLEELLPEFRKGYKIRQKKWRKGAYIEKTNKRIIYHKIQLSELNILEDDFELYQEPIDWDYIIKNKCLCWFWNIENGDKILGVLADKDHDVGYLRDADCYYQHCRPVRRDEVNFYEDRKDD